MSARSRDLISATLISAGIIGAGEVHMAAGGESTSAFQTYWKDWFDNDRFHTSTNDVFTGYTALTAGQNDVLLVGPGVHNLTSGTLAWNKAETHLVGAGVARGPGQGPTAALKLAGDFTPMISTLSTGTNIFANLLIDHGKAASASTANLVCFQVSSGSTGGVILRDCWVKSPNDTSIAAAESYRCIVLQGGMLLIERCMVGGRSNEWTAPSGAHPAFIDIDKKGLGLTIVDSQFLVSSTVNTHRFMIFKYSPWGGSYFNIKNTQFINASSGDWEYAIQTSGGADEIGNGNINVVCDANTFFVGVTDISVAANEGLIIFAPAALPSTGTGLLLTGIGQTFDHS